MSQFPSAVDGAADLFDLRNAWTASLSAGISAATVDLVVDTVTGLQAQGGLLSVGDEVIRYGFVEGLTLRNCTRGYDGTAAASHPAGTKVEMRMVAAHHNALAAAIQQVQAYVGTDPLPTMTLTDRLNLDGPLTIAHPVASSDWSFTHTRGRPLLIECWALDGTSYVQVPATVRQQVLAVGVEAMVTVMLASPQVGYVVAR